ncbi:hypothetical protein A0H81_14316 [Grifola frondosa]|uniref:Cytochrome c oxidase assembly factor 1 n=1 Tax=Grifola frondosa TaxID=5627 RepID=A0A1C7LMB2_GRIFR|nr:hypothetical protein A0H81_14316 [Grifola frondosa]
MSLASAHRACVGASACSRRTFVHRCYATSSAHPRKPLPEVETFSQTARPGIYYPRPQRELPPLKNKWPLVLAFGAIGVSLWAGFMAYVANEEKLSSSVMQQIMSTVREDPQLREVLGEAIRPEPVWWMNGNPRVDGAIHMPGGNVDLSFRLKGHKVTASSFQAREPYILRAYGKTRASPSRFSDLKSLQTAGRRSRSHLHNHNREMSTNFAGLLDCHFAILAL